MCVTSQMKAFILRCDSEMLGCFGTEQLVSFPFFGKAETNLS